MEISQSTISRRTSKQFLFHFSINFLKKILIHSLKSLQALSLILSDDFLLHFNASRIPTNDIIDYLDEITMPIRNFLLVTTFSDVFATVFAKVIGPSGICFNFNMIESQKLYKNLENAPKIFGYSHDILYMNKIAKYNRSPINPIHCI
jgi:hypothetical protein